MATEVKVPELGESVVEATVGEWQVKVGDSVGVGDVLVELETDKVDAEVGATVAGVVQEILQPEGEDVNVGDVLVIIAEGNGAAPSPPSDSSASDTEAPAAAAQPSTPSPASSAATPVAKRMADAEGVDLTAVSGSGPGGKITKNDVSAHLTKPEASNEARGEAQPAPASQPAAAQISLPPLPGTEREERVKMSRRRRTIAKRLVEVQQTAAMLTTFNEIDMGAVMELRKRRQEAFIKRNDIKLGFSSFFVKAVVGALKAFPRLNAEIDGDEMVIKHYYDIGMAVGAEEGLVVPVIREADRKSFADIEKDVKELASKARGGSLSLDDLRGGTFTITNGGVFGSMMSTPILNPPQVGILGLHNIQQRPVARDGEVVIRPMMYVALSYDHRIVDGSEAVRFLVRIKELVEDPETMLLEG